jgi:glutamine amidotransferase
MIALIDYGAGNLSSVRKALAAVGADVWTPEQPAEISVASGLIVPGVGHFHATASLGPEWRAAAHRLIETGRPLLGICLGMQWLYEDSAEAPNLTGLGVLTGSCVHLSAAPKIPHVGWNALACTRPSWILDGVDEGAYVYFTHSYAAPPTSDTIAVTTHGETFAAAVERGNVAGVQFHPEKSGPVGLQVLSNFLARAEAGSPEPGA